MGTACRERVWQGEREQTPAELNEGGDRDLQALALMALLDLALVALPAQPWRDPSDCPAELPEMHL